MFLNKLFFIVENKNLFQILAYQFISRWFYTVFRSFLYVLLP